MRHHKENLYRSGRSPQCFSRRQTGRTPRQQRRHLPHSARRRYAVHGRRHACRCYPDSSRRSITHELGQILELHLGLAANALGYQAIVPPFTGATDTEIKEELIKAGFDEFRQDETPRRTHRRTFRSARRRRIHVYPEIASHGRRQDPHALDRPILAHHSTASRRQGSRRRSALRRNGSLGISRPWRGTHSCAKS